MKKTLNKKFVVALAGFLSFGTLSGVAVETNNKIGDAQAVTTVLVKRAEVSPNGTQLVNGSLNWAAGTNLSISSTTYAGKSCAEFSRSASTSRLAYTGPEYAYYWHKCVLTYSLSTSFTGSYMFTFGSLKQQKLSTGNFQTSVFDYTVDSSKDPSMYKKDLIDGTYFGFNCSDTSVKLYVYSFEFYEQISQGTVSIASGTGISSAFVSSDPNATTGSTSQKFDIGTNVYGFVTTQAGYTMGSGWTLVSGTAGQAGARWRSAYHDVEEESYNFGTINASLKEYDITWNLGGGSATGLPAKYNKGSGFSTSVEPTKRGYTFLGWTGSNGSTPQKTVSVAAGEIGDKFYTANWELNEYTITYNNASGVSNPVSYTVETSAFTLDEPSRTACVFAGWTGSQLSTPTKNLELNPSDPGFVLENKEFTATFEYDPLIQPVVDKILAIGGPSNVSYYGSYAALVDAQEAYDELISAHPEFEEAIVEYDELVDDWAAYNALKEAALADAISKIDAIGTVTYPTSKAAIDSARSAFNALEPGDQVGLSSKEAILQDAEDAYESLRSAAISNAINKIEAISEVHYPTSKQTIADARSAYNAVASEDKAYVTNAGDLTAAESEYASQRSVAISDVVTKINNIGDNITLESESLIVTARTAYEGLDSDDQSEVSNYETLVNDENRLAELKAAKADAEAVDALIDAIGEVTLDKEDEIVAARSAYVALTSDGKGFVTKLSVLEAAEARLAELKAAKADAEAVDALIDAIGTVSYPTSKGAIDAARAAYDALTTDDQTGFVKKLPVLEAAEAAYASLRSNAIADVENKIVAIGEVTYPGSYEAIYEVAETAYNALPEEDKSSVSNHGTLVTAKETYESLRSAAINGVIDQIDDLTEHVITLEDEDEIIAARTAYEALAGGDKSSVTNYQDLVDAEARLVMLKEAKAAAQAVDAKINAIGEVTYPGSKDDIASARTAYNALDSAEKIGFVERYETLLAAEARYEELKNAAIQDAHDKIEAIGEVSYPASKEVLEAAESAYKGLDDDDKVLVTNKEDLVEAREEYNEQRQVNVTIVINIIIQIGDVEYSSGFKAKIDAAQEAYNALTEEQKALVTNYNILVNDVDVYVRIDLVVQKIESIGEVDLSSEESIKAARDAYDALSEEERSLIPNYYNILEEKEQTYAEVEKNHNSGTTLAIVFGTIGGVIFLLALAYVLMMFVFNHWIKKNRQAYRVIKLWKNKEGKRVLIATPCKVIHRYDEEVFKTKDEALK